MRGFLYFQTKVGADIITGLKNRGDGRNETKLIRRCILMIYTSGQAYRLSIL